MNYNLTPRSQTLPNINSQLLPPPPPPFRLAGETSSTATNTHNSSSLDQDEFLRLSIKELDPYHPPQEDLPAAATIMDVKPQQQLAFDDNNKQLNRDVTAGVHEIQDGGFNHQSQQQHNLPGLRDYNRTKNFASERERREQLNDSFRALRSVIPNPTKVYSYVYIYTYIAKYTWVFKHL